MTLKSTNSWHWLAAALAVCAATSAFVPKYGWIDVVKHCKTCLVPQTQNAEAKLAKQKLLRESSVESLERETAAIRERAAADIGRFAAYGFEKIPAGDKAVFDAQSRVNEALAKYNIAVLSTGAKITPRPGERAVPQPQAQAPEKTLSVAEFRAESEKAAAEMKDKSLREMFLADAMRKAAQMEAAEKKKAKNPAPTVPHPKPDAKPSRNFKTSEIAYVATGDFRDIFLFFVSETRIKPCYSFKDISVAAKDGAMILEFTLQVNHK